MEIHDSKRRPAISSTRTSTRPAASRPSGAAVSPVAPSAARRALQVKKVSERRGSGTCGAGDEQDGLRRCASHWRRFRVHLSPRFGTNFDRRRRRRTRRRRDGGAGDGEEHRLRGSPPQSCLAHVTTNSSSVRASPNSASLLSASLSRRAARTSDSRAQF